MHMRMFLCACMHTISACMLYSYSCLGAHCGCQHSIYYVSTSHLASEHKSTKPRAPSMEPGDHNLISHQAVKFAPAFPLPTSTFTLSRC